MTAELRLGKDGQRTTEPHKERRVTTHPRHLDAVFVTPQDTFPQKPSARNTPMLSFQPHHTQISTVRPSISGRLFLHIPKLAGKKFHFVSLALHLRLKEAIAWTRQDLVTFEIEKQGWSQTVWEKRLLLPYQDRQVEEGDEPYVAVVKEPSRGKGRIEIAADEWRWEWLIPVTEGEVRPESFEGTMGNVWYELEGKCVFRWDDIDANGNTEAAISLARSLEATSESTASCGSARHPGSNLLKGIEGSSKKAKSLAQALGKLRVGTKSKKFEHSGDFKVANQHDEFVKRSLRMRNNSLLHYGTEGCGLPQTKAELLSATSRGRSTPHLGQQDPGSGHTSEPLPFLIRKILKLYFVKPPPNPSANPSFFLPPPSMALPALPGTRRLKAIIPGARIQVHIQIPSLIPIPGYAQTSQLVPDHKKGGLVLSKHVPQSGDQQHTQNYAQHHHLHLEGHSQDADARPPDTFHVALTVQKLTQSDISKNDTLKKRFQNAAVSSSASPFASIGVRDICNEDTAHGGTRSLASSISSSSLGARFNAGSDGVDGIQEASGPNGVKAAVGLVKAWRSEIRVRKVKCEFWQKESCRIPTSSGTVDTTSRTIKYALGPAYTYSEKEQGRERTSIHLLHTQHGPTHVAPTIARDSSAARVSACNDSTPSSSISPTLKSTLAPTHQKVPETSPPSAPGVHHAPPDSQPIPLSVNSIPRDNMLTKPFMLVIPVPLSSPNLRQTYTWPTVDTPSPLRSITYAGDTGSLAMPKAFSTADAESKYPSPQALYRMAMIGTAADNAATIKGSNEPPGGSESGDIAGDIMNNLPLNGSQVYQRGHHPHNHISNAASFRPRIEVKHYLSLRLSIDMLEFEGEVEQDEEQGLEAMQDLHLPHIVGVQAGHGRPNIEGCNTNIRSTSATASLSGQASSIASASSYRKIAASGGASGALPTLTFLNSTAGVLDREGEPAMEAVVYPHGRQENRNRGVPGQHQHKHRVSRSHSASGSELPPSPPQPLLGAVCDLEQRRGSGASLGTMTSSTSPGHNLQVKNENLAVVTHGGLVAGAIGAIKKKASFSGLNAMMSVATGGSGGGQPSHAPGSQQNSRTPVVHVHAHRCHQCAAVKVQRLKDFVIRVPITVVVQVDELSCVGTAGVIDGSRESETSGVAGMATSPGNECTSSAIHQAGEQQKMRHEHLDNPQHTREGDEEDLEGHFADNE